MNYKIVSLLVSFDNSQCSMPELCMQLQTALLPWAAQCNITVTQSAQWMQGTFSQGLNQVNVFLTVPETTTDDEIAAAFTEIFSGMQLLLLQPQVLDDTNNWQPESLTPFQIVGAITVSDVGPQPGAGAPNPSAEPSPGNP